MGYLGDIAGSVNDAVSELISKTQPKLDYSPIKFDSYGGMPSHNYEIKTQSSPYFSDVGLSDIYTNKDKEYSIEDVLSAIGGQYQAPQRSTQNQSIDDILAGLQAGYKKPEVTPYKTGVGQYVEGFNPVAQEMPKTYTPAAFDFNALAMPYESPQDKANRVYQETYASQIAAGKSAQEAQAQANKEYQRAAMVGSMVGAAIGRNYGGPIGAMIGAQLGSAAAPIIEPVTNLASDIVGGAKSFVSSVLDW